MVTQASAPVAMDAHVSLQERIAQVKAAKKAKLEEMNKKVSAAAEQRAQEVQKAQAEGPKKAIGSTGYFSKDSEGEIKPEDYQHAFDKTTAERPMLFKVANSNCGVVALLAQVLVWIDAIGRFLTTKGTSQCQRDLGKVLSDTTELLAPHTEGYGEISETLEDVKDQISDLKETGEKLMGLCNRHIPGFSFMKDAAGVNGKDKQEEAQAGAVSVIKKKTDSNKMKRIEAQMKKLQEEMAALRSSDTAVNA